MKRSLSTLSMTVLLALVLAACQEVEQQQPRVGRNPCNPAPVKTPGQLTVGAELLNYPPFLIGKGTDPPPTGFEADFVNEIGRRLRTQVVWRNTAFDSLFAPGPKRWDFGVSQMTITPEREQAVDFSVPYLQADQALVVQAGTPIANVRSIAELKQYNLGGEAGTTGTDYIKQNIQPNEDPSEFDTTADAAQALKSGTIDGQVIDLPIASGIVAESKTVKLEIVGFFRTNENYGAAFEKGSPLKRCVDQAINAMKADGFLTRIQEKWIPGTTGLSEIR